MNWPKGYAAAFQTDFNTGNNYVFFRSNYATLEDFPNPGQPIFIYDVGDAVPFGFMKKLVSVDEVRPGVFRIEFA